MQSTRIPLFTAQISAKDELEEISLNQFVEERLPGGADFILPNITEASLLLGATYKDKGYDKVYIEDLCRGLYKLGAKNVILTGVSFSEDKLGVASFGTLQ